MEEKRIGVVVAVIGAALLLGGFALAAAGGWGPVGPVATFLGGALFAQGMIMLMRRGA